MISADLKERRHSDVGPLFALVSDDRVAVFPRHQYSSESQLVEDLRRDLTGRLADGIRGTASEFEYSRGRTDLIAIVGDGAVVAIEAKLDRWREALHQAYRNRCFAHVSYVALPERAAAIALRCEAEFRDRAVGLVVVTPGGSRCAIRAEAGTPIEPWLTERARRTIAA